MPLNHPAEFDEAQTQEALRAFDRRTFLKLMGASLAASGISTLAGCTGGQPVEKIVPYVRMPEHVVPGLPTYYATVLPTSGHASGFGRGVIVETHEGRPTKIEGNPKHSSSLGGTDIFMQASILDLYDPDRSTMPLWEGKPLTWGQAFDRLATAIRTKGGPDSLRIVLLSRQITSRCVVHLIDMLSRAYPRSLHIVDDPLLPPHALRYQPPGADHPAVPLYDLSKAKRILSLDAHFLGEGPGALRYARDFAAQRRLPREGATERTADNMARLYMAETTLTYTGAMADHRLPLLPSQLPGLTASILKAVMGSPADDALPPNFRKWVATVANDLRAAGQESLVIPGVYAPPEIHAAAHAMNAILGARGKTVRYVEPIVTVPQKNQSLANLASQLSAGDIDLIFVLDMNPAYSAPGDVEFSKVLGEFSRKGGCIVHVGSHVDETAHLSTLHLPLSHALESWGDLRAHDGTDAIMQPLITPLWGTHSSCEILSRLLALAASIKGQPTSETPTDGYDLVRSVFLDRWKQGDAATIQKRWVDALREGYIADSQSQDVPTPPSPDIAKITSAITTLTAAHNNIIELIIRPDPTLSDGTSANNPWLQELPKPLSRLTWNNVALLGPETARHLGISPPDDASRSDLPVIEVSVDQSRVTVPVWVHPGHPEDSCTLYLGGGRRAVGAVGQGIGVDIAPLRRHANPWLSAGTLRLLKQTVPSAFTQTTMVLNQRDIARRHAVSHPANQSAEAPRHVPLSLYDNYAYIGYRWGMVVDLSSCIGCQACVIACQAENNIPTVGPDQVRRGREMHWLRIDTYFGPPTSSSLRTLPANPPVTFLPMLCQHCENAPCEVVCPVEATSHSEEGINEMTYNRCVGTRYCSNNCPYKVRRFNFLHYTALPSERADIQSMQRNPNVTVRSRGVMEKCTYCIQRINRARIAAKRQWAQSSTDPLVAEPALRAPADATSEPLPRLTVVTACQQACPTEAIIFGDINDTASLVHKLKSAAAWKPLHYAILEELNTQPRTTYLASLTNQHPDLASAEDA